ncbi:unnamed protein product [Rhodiola kirilowii]
MTYNSFSRTNHKGVLPAASITYLFMRTKMEVSSGVEEHAASKCP